jgi:hypothetical protein
VHVPKNTLAAPKILCHATFTACFPHTFQSKTLTQHVMNIGEVEKYVKEQKYLVGSRMGCAKNTLAQDTKLVQVLSNACYIGLEVPKTTLYHFN